MTTGAGIPLVGAHDGVCRECGENTLINSIRVCGPCLDRPCYCGCVYGKHSESGCIDHQIHEFRTWSERTIVQRGIELPWQRLERYGPYEMQGGGVADNPPIGTVLEEGVVFVSENTLHEVAERTPDDYLAENPPPIIGYHAQLALEQAGLADRETRGGCHGTPLLRAFLQTEDD